MVSSHIIADLYSYAIIGCYHLWNNYSVNVCSNVDRHFVVNNYLLDRDVNILLTALPTYNLVPKCHMFIRDSVLKIVPQLFEK